MCKQARRATIKTIRRLQSLAAVLLTATLLCLPAQAQPFGDTDVPFVITPDNNTLEMLELAGAADGRCP